MTVLERVLGRPVGKAEAEHDEAEMTGSLEVGDQPGMLRIQDQVSLRLDLLSESLVLDVVCR